MDAIAEQLHAAAIHLSRRLRVEGEALAISAPRLSVLAALTLGGPMRIGALAQAEQVEAPTMTRLVDALERDGYVMRAPDPEDARAVQVRATARGARALTRERALRVRALAEALRGLSPTELESLGGGIDILARALSDR